MDQILVKQRGPVTIQSRSHRQLAAFADWIKPDPDNREEIHKQAGDIRLAISAQATADGLSVTATPGAAPSRNIPA